jgi:hypothetical protein
MPCVHVCARACDCMQTDGEIDDVWCTSMRRLVRREKRFLHEEQKSGNSARLTLSRLDTVATQPRTARATAIFGIRPPDPAQAEERGRENHEETVSLTRFGPFSGVLTCWDFRTPCVRARLRREISTQCPSRSVCEHHSLCACCLCVVFPHVHRLHVGDGS